MLCALPNVQSSEVCADHCIYQWLPDLYYSDDMENGYTEDDDNGDDVFNVLCAMQSSKVVDDHQGVSDR